MIPQAIDFTHVAGSDEGLDVVGLDVVHDAGELVGGEEGLDFGVGFAFVAAADVVDGAAAGKGVHDVGADLLALVRDDADAFAPVHAGHEVIQGEAVHPGAHEADDDHPERIDGEGRAADDGPGDGHGNADVEVQVLVHDLRKDVQSAGGGVDAEQDGLRDAHHQDEDDEVQQRVAHHGVQPRFDELLIRAHPRPKIQQRSQDHGRIDGLGPEFRADQEPCQQKQDGIDRRDDPGNLDRDARQAQDIGDHDGQTGDGSQHEFARHHEIIDSCGGDGHAHGHNDEFLPELPGSQVAENVFHLWLVFVPIKLWIILQTWFSFSGLLLFLCKH